jgi:hypothetical protein
MFTYQVHTIESAPGKSKPALEQLERVFGFVPNIAGAIGKDVDRESRPGDRWRSNDFRRSGIRKRACARSRGRDRRIDDHELCRQYDETAVRRSVSAACLAKLINGEGAIKRASYCTPSPAREG